MQLHSSIRISIPEPCNVPWESMSPLDAEKRYCSSCERVITDFSKMSDAELLAYFQKSQKVCGRLTEDQLNRNLFSVPAKELGKWKPLLLLSSLLLGLPAFAQRPQTEKEVISQSVKNVNEQEEKQHVVITGVVSDSASSRPLPLMQLFLRTGTDTVRFFTDKDGCYSVTVLCNKSDSIELEVADPFYETSRFRFSATESTVSCNFALVREERRIAITGGAVAVCAYTGDIAVVPVKQKPVRGFFYRLFHRKRY